LKDHVLPNYDDIQSIAMDLVDPLVTAVERGRLTAPKVVETPFGNFDGKTSSDVTELVIEIIDTIRYADVRRIFLLLAQLLRNESSEKTKKKIKSTAENLAKYDIAIWKKVGPSVQMALLEVISGLGVAERQESQDLIVVVINQILSSA